MLQLKVFYNVSFPDGCRCEVITTDESYLVNFEVLLEILRSKIDCLQFIPDEELRIQYEDDEDTFVNLRVGESFRDALRCAKAVSGTAFRRLKIKVQWQPKSTPEMIVSKRREITEQKTSSCTATSSTGGASKKQLLFDDKKCTFPTSASTRMSVPTPFESYTDRLKSNTTTTSSPVDRMLARKWETIETATKELENAKLQKENFERELSKAVLLNSGTMSICGKCHLKLGHTRRNCDGEDCTSVMLCGVLDKHPGEKSTRRSLAQKVTKCKTQLANLQSDYKTKFEAYKSVEDSFAKKIEEDIIASDPPRYISNGVKNWALLNKHVALLQKKCNGKLSPRHTVTRLLDEAVREHEMKTTFQYVREKGVNPKKRILEEDYGISFPRRSSSATCSFLSPSVLPPSELEDFRLAVRLQDQWNREEESASCTPLPSCSVEPADGSDMYIFVPNEGCRVNPSSESKQEHDAANALVELGSLAKSE